MRALSNRIFLWGLCWLSSVGIGSSTSYCYSERPFSFWFSWEVSDEYVRKRQDRPCGVDESLEEVAQYKSNGVVGCACPSQKAVKRQKHSKVELEPTCTTSMPSISSIKYKRLPCSSKRQNNVTTRVIRVWKALIWDIKSTYVWPIHGPWLDEVTKFSSITRLILIIRCFPYGTVIIMTALVLRRMVASCRSQNLLLLLWA